MVDSTASDGSPCKTIFIRDTGTHNALSKTTNSVRNFAMENGGRIIKMSTVKDGPFAKASEGKKSSRLIVKFDNGDTAQIDIIHGAIETRFSVHADDGRALFDDSNDVLGEARAVYDAWHDSDGNAKPGYMLAPNGKPTNLTERQWIQVRTPSFKKWFGDWESLAEIDHAVDFCLNGNPVSELTGKEFQKNGEHDLVDRITEFFKSIGGVVENNELGVVVLDRESVKSSIGHGIGRSKAAAFAAVPDVIRDGVLFDRQKNWKGRGTNTYVIAAPIRIGSENYVCEAIVEEKVGRKAERRFYLHEVNLQSTVSDTIKTPTGGVGIGNPSRPVRSILARKAVEFNRKDVSKVVDENGEPKVVYHGTPHGGHTVFNGSKNGSYSYSVDGTTFFSSSQNVAMSYSTDPKTKYSDLPKSAIEDARRYIDSSHSEVRKEDNGRFGVYLDGEYVADSDADTLETALEKAAVSIASSMEKNPDSMTYNVFLSVKNPVTVDFNGGSWRGERSADGYYDNSVPIIAERAKRSGHDGLIVKNVRDAANILGRGIADDYAVFSPSKIKSATDNTGAFDNTNPDIRYSIGGVRGASALGISGVADAEAMEKDGIDREDIWRKTGWWRGKDGKWRVEIPDVKRKAWHGDPEERHFTGGGDDFYRYKLTEMVRDNGLFDAYPSLKKIKVEFHKNMPANIGGNFNEETLTIKMPQKFHLTIDWAKEGLGDGKSAELNEAGRKTIVHELHHAIQLFEGLAKGGSPTEPVRPYALDGKTGHALSVFSEAVGMDPTNAGELAIIAYWAKKIASDQIGDDVPKRLAEKFETAAKEAGKTPQEFRDEIERFYDSKTETPMGQYFKLEGEVEARNVQTRLGMTPEDRAATPPWETEDVPADRQIVRFSVTAADDSSYMDAVNRGDMEAAQRMVDDAFDKSEGYRDETGQYHYRESVHAVGYRIGRIPSGGRSYNTREGRYEEGVSLIGVGNLPPVHSFAISALRDAGANVVYLEGDVLTTTGGDDEFLMTNAKPITRKKFDKALRTDAQKIAEKTLADRKWDLSAYGSYKNETMKWANAAKAITLDPVTYDDAGNVIPLSQRFNRKNTDIRYSVQSMSQLGEQANAAIRELSTGKDAVIHNSYGDITYGIGETGKLTANGRIKGGLGLMHIVYSRMAKDGATLNDALDIAMLVADALENGTESEVRHNKHYYQKDGIEAVFAINQDTSKPVLTGYRIREDESDGAILASHDLRTIPPPRKEDVVASLAKRIALLSNEGQASRFSVSSADQFDGKVQPWPENFPKVMLQTTLANIKQKWPKLHEAAKAGSNEAALKLVQNILGDERIGKKANPKWEKLRAFASAHPGAIVVPVHAEEATGRNRIPAAYAAMIKKITGLPVDIDIVQSVRAHHTGANAADRMTRRAAFDGPVERGTEYLLVDDHVTQGGTLNELRKYIQSHGGKVVAVTTLTASQFSDTLAISRDAEIGLYEKFGKNLDEELQTAGIANGVAELTKSQARELLKLRVDTFRDRIAQARLARQRELDAQAVGIAGRARKVSGRADNVGPFGEDEAGIRHSIGGLYTGTAVDRYGIGLAKTVIPEEQNRDIQNLYIQASENIPMLKDIAYRLCAISVMGTASFRLPNREENDLQVKKRDTIIEKANRLYGGDVSQVVDIIAATVTLFPEDSYIDSLSSIDSETG